MLKRLVILAVLVLGIVYSAWPQIPRDGSQQDRPAQREADKSQLAQPSPPTLQVQTSPAKQEEGAKEKPSGYPWDELLAPANIPNWMLCIVGAVAGIAAVLTLNHSKTASKTAPLWQFRPFLRHYLNEKARFLGAFVYCSVHRVYF